ncbi:MAG: hypothetical protein RBR20_13445 [Desulfobacterales bacterium]|nr:hypothetical protein [Desulfobacterales bacterium]
MSRKSRDDGMGGGGGVVLVAMASIGFLVGFLLIPLWLGFGYIRSRLAMRRGVTWQEPIFERSEIDDPLYLLLLDRRRRIWLLPIVFAILFTLLGSGPSQPVAIVGGFLGLLMFALLPFVGFFGPLENALGLLRKKLVRRSKNHFVIRVLLLLAFLAVGVVAVVPVKQSAVVTDKANHFLIQHYGKHQIRYRPAGGARKSVCLAVHWLDLVLARQQSGPAGKIAAGFVGQAMWINAFAINVAIAMDVGAAADMILFTHSRKCPGVKAPLLLGGRIFDHRQVLGFNLLLFGFGTSVWLFLTLCESWVVRCRCRVR